MYNIIGRCQKSVADASGLLQRICILWPVPGLRLSRPSGARDTNNAITVECEREREKTVSSLAFLLHRTTIYYYRRRIDDALWWRCWRRFGRRGGVPHCRRVVQTTVATLSVPDCERLTVRKAAGPPRFVRVPYQRTTREKLFFIVCSSLYGFTFSVGQRWRVAHPLMEKKKK